MIIRYAETADYSWLIENDIYISEDILKQKIELKEVYVVEQGNELIGWPRYNLFWDNIPFMNMLFRRIQGKRNRQKTGILLGK